MSQNLRLERSFLYHRNAFFRILELPFSALLEYIRESPLGLSLDIELFEESDLLIDLITNGEKTLSEEIVESLPLARLDDQIEMIAEYIAYNLDQYGRMNVTMEEICEKFKVDVSAVQKAMVAIKEVGPEGVLEGKVIGYGMKSSYVEPDIIVNDDMSVTVREIQLKPPRNADKIQMEIFLFLSEAVSRRKQLLLNLGQMFVRENTLFLAKKISYPQKIRMTQAASSLNVSVSTISRAVSGKYVKTSTEIFPLRIFFGRNVEKEYLLTELARILNESDRITDAEVSQRLRMQGILVSRRTVNKYRQIVKRFLKRE
ncbi:MAG TPA: hypothetical protein PLP64_00690 [Pseudothermotoga sp.]|nr:hypothetical protein [Pseudothermotoga sp.]HOK82733.1 hypothetical protein [Pseudothermotoga sp.]HPP70829.1 hypothetical protein [Pseudothermotoga sp.]